MSGPHHPGQVPPGQLPPGPFPPGQLPPGSYPPRPPTAASQARQGTARRRTRIAQIVATALVVAAAVSVGVYLIVTKDDGRSSSAAARGPAGAAAASGPLPNSTADGAYRVSGPASGAAVTLSLFEDFQCPACREFESMFGGVLTQIRALPGVAVDYHPITFLDSASSTRYSTRAANASACVAEATGAPVPESSGGSSRFAVWLRFHDALYAQQPQEGSAGLPDSTLVTMAVTAGAPTSVESCIAGGTHQQAIAGITRRALTDDKVQGTPTVRINGDDVDLSTPSELLAAVQKALR
ncbi:DsbA family protein [Williamsia sp. CHRR-6]|uniref:DsbA family protein n=1 Tax=Williamsia sp. CHRR-6 TaxID=2835871 RepID=UPI001BDB4538|nr:DsbA family protein [Williamsia sp. CHRR-6]MBT0566566.1 DsbA family protein [Williamsia sp. CHRR-6]